jgi:catechol 2,3-dioxygenase-like lactoylglutathione lyase family enzyme
MEHVGIVVDDLAAATEFFVELGLELQGEGPVEGRSVDRVVGLDGVRLLFTRTSQRPTKNFPTMTCPPMTFRPTPHPTKTCRTTICL